MNDELNVDVKEDVNMFNVLIEPNLVDNVAKNTFFYKNFYPDIYNWRDIRYVIYKLYNKKIPMATNKSISRFVLNVVDDINIYFVFYTYDNNEVKIGIHDGQNITDINSYLNEFSTYVHNILEFDLPNYFKSLEIDKDDMELLSKYSNFVGVKREKIYEYYDIDYRKYLIEFKKINEL